MSSGATKRTLSGRLGEALQKTLETMKAFWCCSLESSREISELLQAHAEKTGCLPGNLQIVISHEASALPAHPQHQTGAEQDGGDGGVSEHSSHMGR